ncbi:protein mago nashi [Angomonas deanei]|nr:protein mago nashi [Angomonas deanei]|eukprot:EPY41795.1 protein mago nashi [Angomonas deanei]
MEMSNPEGTGDTQLHYIRYYVGHTGRYGKEFLEFEVSEDGVLRYTNNSRYRNENIIKKQ